MTPRSRLLGPLVSLGALALSLAALEVAVRVFVDDGMNLHLEMWKYAREVKRRSDDPSIGHEHRPNARSFLMGVHVATNSAGHRDRELAPPAPGTRRVVMLGDSFVEGWGVPVEATVSNRLERMFLDAGQSVDVLNLGVGNYNTLMQVEAFFAHGGRLNPDLVVLNYTFNDAEPVPSYPSRYSLASHSAAAVLLSSGFDALSRRLGFTRDWAEYYLALYEQPGWQVGQDALRRLAEDCRRRGIALLIVSWPELHDPRNYVLAPVTERVREVARAEGVPFVDLLQAVREEEPSKLWVTPADPHPNAYANELFARQLFPAVQRELGSASLRAAAQE